MLSLENNSSTNTTNQLELIIIIFTVFYGLGLYYWAKHVTWRLNQQLTGSLKWVHYVGAVICILVVISNSQFNIGLRGLWTTRIIIITTILTGTIFILIGNTRSIKSVEKWYFRLFSGLPIYAALTLLLPFIGFIIVFSLFGQLVDPADKIFYEDQHLRIQSSFVGVLGPPQFDIYEKNLIFEKHYAPENISAMQIDSLQVSYDSDSTRIRIFGLYNYDEARKHEIETICLHPIQ